MIFDGKSVIDNINIHLGTYENVGLFEGSPNPYTFFLRICLSTTPFQRLKRLKYYRMQRIIERKIKKE